MRDAKSWNIEPLAKWLIAKMAALGCKALELEREELEAVAMHTQRSSRLT